MATRFIFFDLGNVLLRFSHVQMARQAAEVVGCAPEAIRSAVFGDGIDRELECGRISEVEFFEACCRTLGKRPDPERFAWALNDIFQVIEDMQPVVDRLVAMDFPRGILSNVGSGHWNFCLNSFSFLKRSFPDNHVLSYRVGAMKPDHRIYEAALRAARTTLPDIRPDEVLFTDDLELNVQSARDFGFDAVRFDGADALLEALRERNV